VITAEAGSSVNHFSSSETLAEAGKSRKKPAKIPGIDRPEGKTKIRKKIFDRSVPEGYNDICL